jgi:hypothetical protein
MSLIIQDKHKKLGSGSYTSSVCYSSERIYKAWVEMDVPVTPPIISKKIKGKENQLYNSITLSPMMDKDKWQWVRYFKGNNRADVCKQFNQWLVKTVRKNRYPTVRSKPLNEIAFVENPNDELFYSSDMDLGLDTYSFMPMSDIEKIIESSKGKLEFNDNPSNERQRLSLRRPKGYKSITWIKIEKHLYKHKRTGYYSCFYGKDQHSLLTDDLLRAKEKLKLVLHNLRRKLEPFAHEQNLVQRTKKEELRQLADRLKRYKESKQVAVVEKETDDLMLRLSKVASNDKE